MSGGIGGVVEGGGRGDIEGGAGVQRAVWPGALGEGGGVAKGCVPGGWGVQRCVCPGASRGSRGAASLGDPRTAQPEA